MIESSTRYPGMTPKAADAAPHFLRRDSDRAPQIEKTAEVPYSRAIGDLSSAIEMQHKMLCSLADRLSNVLEPAGPSDPAGKPIDYTSAPLVLGVAQRATAVRDCNTMLADILARLAI